MHWVTNSLLLDSGSLCRLSKGVISWFSLQNQNQIKPELKTNKNVLSWQKSLQWEMEDN